ncbi:MAG TPA: LysR family transcriptional regulator [Tenuifilaceae bacterium]|nr:LysR family transcriptional regulator [Tenuifilaceae bacterium]HPE19586.1 LysR family transcriptional regulator [Tenuifilaceae bacterium]
MAGRKGSKYYDIFLKHKVWLENINGEDIVGGGKFDLLLSIDETQCITASAENLGISYRKAWGNIREIEQRLGFPVVEKHRGGKEGGKTVLNAEGKKLIDAYREFLIQIDTLMHDAAKEFWNKIND